ncbi:signal peptide peptidase SppA [Staphylococcus canis]|uniref:Signal peptide peptidase SppA n=1 Tax=Staphylococcus canis TaxID=2724942 RepID=A0ABS0T6Q4_9STAP|nr:signal peptide peptidase SppA [Staphylococcus canis]MBI5974240.1 signal peptide peptidase SppA [Staphylococcus canis]
MSKRIVAIILAVAIVMIGIIMSTVTTVVSSIFSDANTLDEDLPSSVVEKGDASHQIAEINIDGEIMDLGSGGLFGGTGYDHQNIIKQLESIQNDSTVKGVLLNINTPGGGVYESDELYQKIKETQKKGKKIYVQMKSLVASGGYYISAPADKIYAGPQSMTGSIGVISQSTDYSELMNRLGVKTNTIKSGDHKDIMSPTREMTDEERAILQSINKDSYDRFVEIVSDGRHMSESKVRQLADGRLYSANQAKSNGLIDKIGYKDTALKDMKKEIGAKDAQIITYDEASSGMGSFFGMKTFYNDLKADIEHFTSLVHHRSEARPMYMYEG